MHTFGELITGYNPLIPSGGQNSLKQIRLPQIIKGCKKRVLDRKLVKR